jgi:hypothetical protein
VMNCFSFSFRISYHFPRVVNSCAGRGITTFSYFLAVLRIRIRDKHLRSYFRELNNNFGLKLKLNSLLIQFCGDPRWKNSDPGSGMEKSGIRHKHTGSVTLLYRQISVRL